MGNPNEEGRRAADAGEDNNPGPFLGKVISHLDPYYMGSLEVEIQHKSGNQNARSGQIVPCKYMSPFSGITSVDFTNENNDYDSTQKSYGFWFVPPDPGTTVIVFMIDGDPTKAYWIGCVPDPNMNFMIPGYAASSYTEDAEEERVPVAEYNKKSVDVSSKDTTQLIKPFHKFFQDALLAQGLLKDDIRGITTSSARREVPSAVFGISTPGPVDKQGPGGTVGKFEHSVDGAKVSRLGGSSFVMDDGDDKFIRMTNASEGPPEYEAVEQLGDGEIPTGNQSIPHNELIRLRTRTGHQILLHNSEDLIYIGNARGTAWIELTSDGKIDIFAEDSISVRTKQDFNFYADRDFNIEVGRNFNLKVAERHQTEVGTDKILIVDANNFIKVSGTHDETVSGATKINLESTLDINVGAQTNLTVGGGFDLNTSGDNKLTSGGNMEIAAANTTISGGNINLNGPAAASAGSASSAEVPEPLSTFANPDETEATIDSIMLRIPSHEPWPHHENLDPASFKPEATDREAGSDIAIPDYWKSYTTITDTFSKIRGGGE